MGNLNRDVFAIKVGEFVEFRASRKPLMVKVSKLTKTIVQKKGTLVENDSFWGDGVHILSDDVKKKIVLKQIFFVGGTVIGYTKAHRFPHLFKRAIPKDKAIRLKPEYAALVLSPSWRRKNL